MIQVLWKDNRSIPLVVCDECREPIANAGLAMVAYESDNGDGTYRELAFLHKGACDEGFKGGRNRDGGWVELRHFLVNLCHNAGMPAGGESMAQAIEERRDLDMLP